MFQSENKDTNNILLHEKEKIYHIYNLFLYTMYLDIYKIKKAVYDVFKEKYVNSIYSIFYQYFAHAFHSSGT